MTDGRAGVLSGHAGPVPHPLIPLIRSRKETLAMAKKPVVYATTNCTVAHNGEAVTVRASDPWDGDSPIVKAYPSLFVEEHDAVRSGDRGEIAPVDDNAPVERATRAPGEKRPGRASRR